MAPPTTNNTTENHDLQLWQQVPEDEEDWQNRTDMQAIERGLQVRDLDANRGDYTAHQDAMFRATDTGAIYLGDGENWNKADISVASAIVENEPSGLQHVARMSEVVKKADKSQMNGIGDSVNDLKGSVVTSIRDASNFNGADGGAQIQAAIDDLPPEGGQVFVPAVGPDTDGRWDISSKIVPASNTTLLGVAGATTLYLTDGTNDDMIQTDNSADSAAKENIIIDGFHLEGNGANQSGIGETYVYGSCGIRLINCVDSYVRNCTINDTKKHSIEVKKSKHIRIEKCVSTNAGDDGISVSDTLFDTATSEDIIVSQCRATGATDNGMEVDDGPRNVRFIDCYSHVNGTNGFVIHTHRASDPQNDGSTDVTYAPAAPQEIYFTNCSAIDNERLGFAVGHHSSGVPRDYFLSNVYARGNGESPFRSEITEASEESVEITNVNVNGFYFEGGNQQNQSGGWTAGIKLDRGMPWNDLTFSNGIVTGSLGYGMNITGCSINGLTVDNVIFEGDNIDSYTIMGSTNGNGDTIEDFRFTNCVVKDGQVGGFAMNIASSDSLINGQVANCTFKNNGRGDRTGSHWDSGIVLEGGGTLENVAFTGNLCYDDDAGTQSYGIHRGTEDYCTFVGNICHGNVEAQFGGSLGANSSEAANISRP